MSLQLHITINERSYAWQSGDAPEQLDAAITFLREYRETISSPIHASKPIVTDNPDFVLTKPK